MEGLSTDLYGGGDGGGGGGHGGHGGGLAGGHHGGQGRGHGARHQHLAPGGGLDTETRGLLLHTLLLRVLTGS